MYHFSSEMVSQIITKQKTEQLFWRGLGGRNRPPIGGLGDSPPNLGFVRQMRTLITLTEPYCDLIPIHEKPDTNKASRIKS
ncbi:hypothetical protein, partial [Nostoc sp. 106C]|uniref:hypothetical protein n=1 Tax=Nostoc sp. 106C TaxID=1932667 RepID=UPI001AA182A8